jgi:hypothetical protein
MPYIHFDSITEGLRDAILTKAKEAAEPFAGSPEHQGIIDTIFNQYVTGAEIVVAFMRANERAGTGMDFENERVYQGLAAEPYVESDPLWVVYNVGGWPLPFTASSFKRDTQVRCLRAFPGFKDWAAMRRSGFKIQRAIVAITLVEK